MRPVLAPPGLTEAFNFFVAVLRIKKTKWMAEELSLLLFGFGCL